MKIYSLNPVANYTKTGGNKLEGIIVETLNSINDSPVLVITDEYLGVGSSKKDKLLSYWKNWRRISEADVILTNISNRRLCFFLGFLKRRNPKITVLVTHHHFAFMTYNKPSLRKWFTKFFEMNILNSADIIAVSGQYTYEQTLKRFEKNRVFFTGVPIEKNVTSLSRKDHGELLFIGTIEPRKGLNYLVDALAKVKENYHISIAGNYSGHIGFYNSLLEKIRANGTAVKIEFLGRISDSEKEELLNKAYAFIFPTLNEGYGIVMLEAMGHGIPVIAFNNSSIPYIVKDHINGLLVKNRNVDDLANKISYILNNPSSVAEMGAEGLKTYEEAEDVQGFKDKISELYYIVKGIHEGK